MRQVWIISDGKPGHLNQSLGLAEALQRRYRELEIRTLPALSFGAALKRLVMGGEWENPALLIGAGQRTHLSLLAYKRATGAPAVVMMRPSLPAGWFDLCLVPAHDQPAARPNLVETSGALNRMQPLAERPEHSPGLILIGGPSKHFHWDDAAVIDQLRAIATGAKPWVLTTSRRTPDSFLTLLTAAELPGLTLVPFEETGPGWLAEQLPRASECWVSGDSVSMVFEALTAGCAVGILELSPATDSRIARGLQQLIEAGKVTPFGAWRETGRLMLPDTPFNEADRCAELVGKRFFQ